MSFDFICNVILGTLCVYQGYRIHQLKLDILDQIIDLKKTIKGLCKTLTKQSNILGSPLVKYRFVTDEAFYIVTSPKFKHRDFMYKWVKSADCKEMNLIEIVNGEPVPLKEKMIYGDPEIDGDYEYALLCLEANGFSAAKIKNPK